MNLLQDMRYWTFFGLGLSSMLLLMGGLNLWWSRRRRERSHARLPGMRLATSSRPEPQGRWLAASGRVQQLIERLPGIGSYDLLLQQTGWAISSAQALLGSLVLALATLLIGGLLNLSLALSLTLALSALVIVHAVLLWKRQHRCVTLERQLPDALALMARSMQAGHAFSSALQIAAQESPAPMGAELRGVFSEVQYGESVSEALSHWAGRVAGPDVRIFVIAVRIQSETGGNLAELLHRTAALIRERQKLRGVVRVLSAEGRISAVILTLLPFALAAMLWALNPRFMSQLWTDPLGIRMLGTALVAMGVGVLWMWRLARIQP